MLSLGSKQSLFPSHLTITDLHVRMENHVCGLWGVSGTDSKQMKKNPLGKTVNLWESFLFGSRSFRKSLKGQFRKLNILS